MDEALILEKLDKLTEEVQSLKSGVLGELKQDLQPIIKQATPHVTSFLGEVDDQFEAEELVALLRKLLSNMDNFNSAMEMMKAGMELRDDAMPIIQQVMPKITTFLGEVDGQYDNEELVALLRKLLSNMDNFNSAMEMMKAGMELKDDAMPIIQQVMPKITTFLGEVDGQYDNKELVALLRKLLSNMENFNSALDMMKAGMELKDDAMPIIQQLMPKVTTFLGEVDGQFESEELVALLRKLLSNMDNFNSALDMMKAGMELKDDAMPIIQQLMPKITTFLGEVDGQFESEELVALLRKLLSNMDNFNSALDMMKAGMELKDDAMPIIQQLMPKITTFLGEVDGQFESEELVALLRKLLSNMDNFNSALDMMKAGMELKDDAMPIIQQLMPKITTFLGEVDGQFESEELVALLRKLLSNMDNFNSALDMMKAGMELKDDAMPIIQQLMPKVISFLNEIEQRGLLKIIDKVVDAASGFRCSDDQLGTMCQAIEEIDLGKPSYVGPIEIMNEIRDPNVQETLGFAFKIMRAVGCCLRANRLRQVSEEYPEEYPGASASN